MPLGKRVPRQNLEKHNKGPRPRAGPHDWHDRGSPVKPGKGGGGPTAVVPKSIYMSTDVKRLSLATGKPN